MNAAQEKGDINAVCCVRGRNVPIYERVVDEVLRTTKPIVHSNPFSLRRYLDTATGPLLASISSHILLIVEATAANNGKVNCFATFEGIKQSLGEGQEYILLLVIDGTYANAKRFLDEADERGKRLIDEDYHDPSGPEELRTKAEELSIATLITSADSLERDLRLRLHDILGIQRDAVA